MGTRFRSMTSRKWKGKFCFRSIFQVGAESKSKLVELRNSRKRRAQSLQYLPKRPRRAEKALKSRLHSISDWVVCFCGKRCWRIIVRADLFRWVLQSIPILMSRSRVPLLILVSDNTFNGWCFKWAWGCEGLHIKETRQTPPDLRGITRVKSLEAATLDTPHGPAVQKILVDVTWLGLGQLPRPSCRKFQDGHVSHSSWFDTIFKSVDVRRC